MNPPLSIQADVANRREVVEVGIPAPGFLDQLVTFHQLAVLHLQLDLMDLQLM